MNTAKKKDIAASPEAMPVETPTVTVFICANCARPGKATSSAIRPRPVIPDFGWPFPVKQIIVPCAGRIQPEHLLKAFETGSDVVTVIACEGENCHYIEGSKRCVRRVEFVRSILEEIGLGEERLLLSFLPGSAAEDLMVAAGKPVEAPPPGLMDAGIVEVREKTVKALEILPPNPLRLIDVNEAPGGVSGEGMDAKDDNTNK